MSEKKIEIQAENFLSRQTPEYGISANRELWRAVIAQALMDAANTTIRSTRNGTRIKALRWLSGDSNDFHDICQFADLDPQYVKDQAKKVLQQWHNCKDKEIDLLESDKKFTSRLSSQGKQSTYMGRCR